MKIRMLLIVEKPATIISLTSAFARIPDCVIITPPVTKEDVLRTCSQNTPDILFYDDQNSIISFTDLENILSTNCPDSKIIYLTDNENFVYSHQIHLSEQMRIVQKKNINKEIIPAIHSLLQLKFNVTQQEIELDNQSQPTDFVQNFTSRELEIFLLIAKGYSNRQIADHLCITEGTVKNHIVNLYRKIGFHSRTEAVTWAWEKELISSSD